MKPRVDRLLVERGLARSRGEAAALLLAGRVFSGERRIDKPGALLAADAPLVVRAGPRFVSRGGDKLLGALTDLALDVTGRVCCDVGASTGGFTDCLLQHGARRVYAIDVGKGLLDARLRGDPRVVVREETNARALAPADFPEPLELVVVDASFIGLAKLLPALRAVLPAGGELLALVKPQFEVGREAARRARGVVRDPVLREGALEGVRAAVVEAGFVLLAGADSRVAGPKGNVEHFLHARAR